MDIDADDIRLAIEELIRAEGRAREAASVDPLDIDQVERTAAIDELREAREELVDALETWTTDSRSWLARARRLPARLEGLEEELELDVDDEDENGR